MTLTRQEYGVRAHKTVIHNDTVYLAGMIAATPFLPMKDQMAEVLGQMVDRLERAGSSKEKLIMVNIFCADMRRVGEINEAWDAWLDEANAPARACVEGGMSRPGWEVELTAIAALD